ncbi:MAG TPA: SBBP repeat-containing protein [Ignavibacteria bacterium]|nr:hypothetical protein [Bacteroidota bacterium]HRI84527.1 SBBP repeat-containing protein [Ignavibacteria bacterium]HRJ99384.1 SBBP repeat-containing protein [Ignavibacteria bacterium]
MKNLIFKTALIIIIISGNCRSQSAFDWAKSYNPTSIHSQSANDIAAGADGASYVLGYNSRGYNGTDVALIKYSADGKLRWARSFDGGNENNSDIGKSAAVFNSGINYFIYAACDISVSGYGNQAGLLKYDSAGNLLWSKYIATGVNSTVTKLTLDISGNIYIAGGTSSQPYILKFNSNGDTLWMRKPPVPVNYYNGVANDITVDSAGNVYSTGKIYDPVTNFDMITFKYNSSGVLQWNKIYNYVNSSDQGNALEFSSSGNLYVTGASNAANSQPDILIIKYNVLNGDTVWVKRYNGVLNGYDEGKDIGISSDENIYVTGQTDGAVYSGDMITLKYNSFGTLQWVRKYAGNLSMGDAGKKLKVDASGNIYAAGRINDGYFAKFINIKYNPNGDSIWTRLIETSSGNGYEDLYAMAFDNSKNILVTGECDNLDIPVVKYDSAGNLKWMRIFYGAQLIYDYTNCVAADKSGNVYAAGKSRVSQYGDQFTVIKYNSAGVQKWVRSYGVQLFDNYDEAKDIEIDAAGFIYVTGTSYSRFNSSTDLFTVKLDSGGNQIWYSTFNSSAGVNEKANALAVDNSGYVYITGTSQIFSGHSNYLTVKLNTAGGIMWSAVYNGPGNGGDYSYDIEADNSGNVYITGQSSGAGTQDDIATIKYNSSGTQQWLHRYNGSANGEDLGNDLEIDNGGNVYVCGMINEISSGYNSVLLKYNSSGVLRWTKQDNRSDSLNALESGIAIELDTSKTKIYLAGNLSAHGYQGRRAQFLSKYDSSGVKIFGTSTLFYVLGSETIVSGLAVDSRETIYISTYRIFNPEERETDLTAYDSSGSPLHYFGANVLKNSSVGPESKELIAANDIGNVYIGAGIYDSTAGTLMSVIKYNLYPLRARINLLIQGFYNEAANIMTEDTARFYLRNASPPYAIIDSALVFPEYDGLYAFSFKNGSFMTNYYISVKHRNSIETWTAGTVSFLTYGLIYYDFTTDASKAFGGNQIKVDDFPEINYALYSGDVNQDGVVDIGDGSLIDNDAFNFASGYLPTDLNGDSIIDLADGVFTDNNGFNFVSKITP